MSIGNLLYGHTTYPTSYVFVFFWLVGRWRSAIACIACIACQVPFSFLWSNWSLRANCASNHHQLDDNFLSWAVWEANDRFNYQNPKLHYGVSFLILVNIVRCNGLCKRWLWVFELVTNAFSRTEYLSQSDSYVSCVEHRPLPKTVGKQ